jgi:predicted DNA-binding protein
VYTGVYPCIGGEAVISKIRTNIFLTAVELRKLRELSKKIGAPVAELVRRAIDQYLERAEKKKKRG